MSTAAPSLLACLFLASTLAFNFPGPAFSENVLVELFTSEGCSSCPPADRLLSRLNGAKQGEINVVCLSEHVDYWNYLGWQDPYSQKLFSQRQAAYAGQFGLASCYTPQMVVDGSYEGNGAGAQFAGDAIRRSAASAKAEVNVVSALISGGNLKLDLAFKPQEKFRGEGRLFAALCQDDLVSIVKSGENGGSVLRHVAVVRQLKELPNCSLDVSWKKNFVLPVDKKLDQLKLVVFIQDAGGKVAAVSSRIAL